MSGILFVNTAEVVTCESADESCILERGAVAVIGAEIVAVGSEADLRARYPDLDVHDCEGGVLTPGFVDSHTHAVFGRWRSEEYALRSSGVPYMEIARRGGGIHASVRDLRTRSEAELVELARPRLQRMLQLGTTTAEIKSGYGLSTVEEIKTLRAIRTLAAETPMRILPTLLGAHEVPREFEGRRTAFVDLVCEEMIPAVAAEDLALFCDVFMEPGVFDAADTRRILEAGASHGMTPKLHADELENSGGAQLAAALNAASADHLGAIDKDGIAALAMSDTVATLLPATLFFLGRKQYAPARALIEAGATIALATDFNPGSAPSQSMPLVLTLACSQMGLAPIQALHAATAGGAAALRLTDGTGTIRTGSPADLVLWQVSAHHEIPYRFGAPPVAGVWARGRHVAGRL